MIIKRNIGQIQARASTFDIKFLPNTFSDTEKDFIRTNYGKISDKAIAEQLNRSYSGIRKQLSEMGLTKKTSRGDVWTEEQITELIRLFPYHSNLELSNMEIFKGKDIISKAYSLKLHKHSIRYREILCIELNKYYKDKKDAELDTGVNSGLIYAAVSGAQELAGGYHWCYSDDLEMKEKYSMFLGDNLKKRKKGKSKKLVRNVETGEIFEGQHAAEEKYHTTSIHFALKTGFKAAGYHWEFVNE